MRLPENKREKVISDMEVGEYGFVTPWSMCVDSDMECFMKTNLAVYTKAAGTVNLKIKRVQDGYIAFIHSNNHEWQVLASYEIDFSDATISPVVGFDETSSDSEHCLSETPFHKLSVEELKLEMEKAASTENFDRATKIRDFLKLKHN
jgi:hypothetical protein